MDRSAVLEIAAAARVRKPVSGLTHGFYKYPARFSPFFARAAIKALTTPGDIVLDPFVGGGTTLVEARVLGRRAIGADISPLAVFVSQAKTTLLSEADCSAIEAWADGLLDCLNLRRPATDVPRSIRHGYQRNISGRQTWPIRKALELALERALRLPNARQQRFARCVLLKTAQWALDCRRYIPSTAEFREELMATIGRMLPAARQFSAAARRADRWSPADGLFRTLCLNCSASALADHPRMGLGPAPRLILTSPPYPGVHVVYHRWQVQGRHETPAPFWLANTLDGNAESFYTFGERRERGLTTYYQRALSAFGALSRIADSKTILVQLVGFADPSWQLPRYLAVMEEAGFQEIELGRHGRSSDTRPWREVPNRRWYADQKGSLATTREVVLFHHLA